MYDTQPLHPLMVDLRRGLLGRCPCCGKGRTFRAFLKVTDRCDVCGEELFHHRADDFPAYVVILLLGHLLVPAALFVEARFAPSYWVHLGAVAAAHSRLDGGPPSAGQRRHRRFAVAHGHARIRTYETMRRTRAGCRGRVTSRIADRRTSCAAAAVHVRGLINRCRTSA